MWIVSARVCLPGSGGRTTAQSGSVRRNFRWPRKLQRRRLLRRRPRRRKPRSNLLAPRAVHPHRQATTSRKRSGSLDRFCYFRWAHFCLAIALGQLTLFSRIRLAEQACSACRVKKARAGDARQGSRPAKLSGAGLSPGNGREDRGIATRPREGRAFLRVRRAHSGRHVARRPSY